MRNQSSKLQISLQQLTNVQKKNETKKHQENSEIYCEHDWSIKNFCWNYIIESNDYIINITFISIIFLLSRWNETFHQRISKISQKKNR